MIAVGILMTLPPLGLTLAVRRFRSRRTRDTSATSAHAIEISVEFPAQ